MTPYLIAFGVVTFLDSVPPGLWALIGTIVGTIGLRFVEKWLSRSREASDIRKDLRDEINGLQERLDKVEEEVSQWRKRAFDAEEQVALLRIIIINQGGVLPEMVELEE